MKMNDAVEGLKYSEDALSNRTIFLANLNDIILYVEDIGKEYEYEEIFERLFEEDIVIFNIFPLGGKEAVINKYRQQGAFDGNGKACIYILDGDFDNLWIDCKVFSSNLIYLTRYNIESYYYNRNAVLKYMRTFMKKKRSLVESVINLDEWLTNTCSKLVELFGVFALVKRRIPQKSNVQIANKFLDDHGYLKADEYSKYLKEVKDEIDWNESVKECMQHIIDCQRDEYCTENAYSILCGKFQLESLCRYLKACSGKNINRQQLRAFLISNFDLLPLTFLKSRILEIVSSSLKNVAV